MKMKKLSVLVALFGISLLVFANPAAFSKTVFLGIGTGGTGGIYYPYGGGVAEIWTQYVPRCQGRGRGDGGQCGKRQTGIQG